MIQSHVATETERLNGGLNAKIILKLKSKFHVENHSKIKSAGQKSFWSNSVVTKEPEHDLVGQPSS